MTEELEERVTRLARYISRGGVVFFGGAGVSTESGIPDFRSAGGLYSRTVRGISPEEMLSRAYFDSHTAEFFDFYRRYLICPDVRPNAAHTTLAALEEERLLLAVITQNIDGLHSDAGSRSVYELHGSVRRNRCMDCGETFGVEAMLKPRLGVGGMFGGAATYSLGSDGVPRCRCGGVIKPGIVLYGESLDTETVDAAIGAMSRARTLIVAGTSLLVQPAASLLGYFHGEHFVLINRTETPADRRADLIFREPVGQVLSQADKLR